MGNNILNILPYMMLGIMLVTSCTKPYLPPAIKAVTGYLVVEGVINPGNDTTKIQLSRTVNLSSDSNSAPVTGAQVTIQGNDNSSYVLTDNGTGLYTEAPVTLSYAKQYRLDIKTPDGQEYQSDYVTPKATPPIDTINFAPKTLGQVSSLQISLNAHDPSNNTRYYRWEYSETWEFHSEYQSFYYSNGDTVLFRPAALQNYYCYSTDQSTSVLLGTSVQLAQDVIAQAPIASVVSTSEKLETEYSILVKQYALTSDAYNFWTNLKKSTEELGSIFDPQPSQINGNIHCITNSSIPVIGYISSSTVQTKRIFVYNSQLPQTWQPVYPYGCAIDSIPFFGPGSPPTPDEDYFYNYDKPDFLGPAYQRVPINAIYIYIGPGSNAVETGHTGSTPLCVDCTLRGNTTKPSFWQ